MRYRLRLEHSSGVQASVVVRARHAERGAAGARQLARELLHVALAAVAAVEGQLADVAYTRSYKNLYICCYVTLHDESYATGRKSPVVAIHISEGTKRCYCLIRSALRFQS